MCEILVWATEPAGIAIRSLDEQRSVRRRGNVIHVADDGWQWGDCELGGSHYTDHTTGELRPMEEHPHGNHSFFRIIKLPNVRKEVAEALMMAEVRQNEDHPKHTLQDRGFHLDLDNFPDIQGYLQDHSRSDPHVTHHMDETKFNKLIRQRRPLVTTFGKTPTVFGQPFTTG